MKTPRISKLVTLFFLMNTLGLSAAYASAFQIGLEAGADLGNEFAGGAAIANDATTNFYNAAGITRAKGPELSFSAVGVLSQTTFKGEASSNFILDNSDPMNPVLLSFSEVGKAKTDSNGVIPAIHFMTPIPKTDKLFFGVSVVVPYGLGINYDDDSVLRYANTKAKAQSVLISPSLAFKLNDHISFAAGPDFEYFNIITKNKVLLNPQLPETDAISQVKTKSWETGWHVGTLLQFNEERTRIGASYRSEIIHDMDGSSRFITPAGFPLPSSKVKSTKATLNIPANALVSVFHSFTPAWDVMASAEYTFWDTFKNVKLTNVATPVTPLTPTGLLSRKVAQNFHNTWHFSVGTQFHANEKFTLKLGLGMDETPTSNRVRSVIIPNADNVATTIGFNYKFTDNLSIDMAYSHAFIDSVKIKHVEPLDGTSETGRSKTTGNAAGIQLNWKMA